MADGAVADRGVPSKRGAPKTDGARGNKRTRDLLQHAIMAHQAGQLDKAERLYRLVLRREPSQAIALNDLGVLLLQRGRATLGEELIRKAVSVKPDYAEAHSNLGSLLRERGEIDAAIAAYEQAIAAKPGYADAHFNLGLAFEKKGDADAALAAFDRALASRPMDAEARFGRANALKRLGRLDEAVAAYRDAITAKPNFAAAIAKLGLTLAQAGEIDEAISSYRRALEINPRDAEVMFNLGIALVEIGEVKAAITEYRHALSVAPEWAPAHFGLGLALLQNGNFAEGWQEYEWRWRGAVKSIKPRHLPKPRWEGEDLAGKTLLLHAEQGLGDTLQFVRFIPGLTKRGARIVLEAPSSLLSLLRMSEVAETIVPASGALPEFDFQLPLLSLPAVLGLDEQSIPAEVPYLVADPARIARWHERLPSGGFRVGIVWQGYPHADIDKGRSIPLRSFAPIAAIAGVRLISLQKNYGLDQLDSLPDGMKVETLGADLDVGTSAFLDTAAVVANIDLVITSDTSIAHLAGALGRPVWIVLKSNPDCRWLLEREDSPWYSTARLFRQRNRGEWTEVFERIAGELAAVVAGDADRRFAPGRASVQVDYITRAKKAFDLGFSRQRDGAIGEATSAYCKAITLDPRHADAYLNLGVIRHGRRQIDEAITLYRRAVAIKPNHGPALSNLVVALTAKGDLGGAVDAARQAAVIKPGDAATHLKLGDLLRRKGDAEGAVDAYRRAVSLSPDDAKAQFNLALGQQHKGELEAAIAGYGRAIELAPGLVQAHANLGAALVDAGRTREGISECRQALALQPDNPRYHSNLGLALAKSDDLEAALIHSRRAIEIAPRYAEGHANLALVLSDMGMIDAAMESGRTAVALKPDYAQAHFNLSLVLLSKGDFRIGWQEYEWRWKGAVKELQPRKFTKPQWQGEDLSGKTLLLHAEQGLGDTLQFVRYAPVLASRGARVVLAVPKELVALLRSVPRLASVVGGGERLPSFDFHLPLMSVPSILGTTEETIPADIPYLSPDPERVAAWQERLGGDGLKVGVVWQGRPNMKIDKGRSIPLAAFAPLAAISTVRLISLQKKHGLTQLDDLPPGMRVETLGPNFDEGPDAFLDTAAVMANLDLIVTSDTSAAHLAGALGRPVWIALKRTAEWRWLLDREDSPWYPTARLFRQREAGDWSGVFERLAANLRFAVAKGPGAFDAGAARAKPAPEVLTVVPPAPLLVPVSTGELMDKITILEIKAERIGDPTKRQNVDGELRQLLDVRDKRLKRNPKVDALGQQLKRVNSKLWQIEDDIRDCERRGDFGANFVALSRSVYRNNDERAALKRKINELTKSALIEEKLYQAY